MSHFQILSAPIGSHQAGRGMSVLAQEEMTDFVSHCITQNSGRISSFSDRFNAVEENGC